MIARLHSIALAAATVATRNCHIPRHRHRRNVPVTILKRGYIPCGHKNISLSRGASLWRDARAYYLLLPKLFLMAFAALFCHHH
jgi:hypothetical protein